MTPRFLMSTACSCCLVCLATFQLPAHAFAAAENSSDSAHFSPFTGKVTRNKVRLRLQPSLEGQVVRELDCGDMLVIVDERDDFFAVRPPADIKGYVFRPYVIDGTIEGNHVNVRLLPDTEAPIIAQLNGGDYVDGAICPTASKWYEITLPSTAQLWVCKEYLEQIGPPNFMAETARRRGEANALLSDAFIAAQQQMAKPFPSIVPSIT